MTPSNKYWNFIELHVAFLFVSTSGVLGKYIQMPAPVIIWWRCAIAAVLLLLFCRYVKYDLRVSQKKDKYLLLIGAVFLGMHWISYFYALYYSNVALALLTLYTYPAITSILEPIILKTKFQANHLLLAVLVMVGVYIMMPSLALRNDKVLAIGLGVFSGFTYALRNILTKDLAGRKHGSVLMLYQLIILTILLVPILFFMDTSGISDFWLSTTALALIATAIGHTLIIRSFKNFSITSFSLLSSVIPVLGILWAYIFLAEIPEWKTLFGGGVILLTVFMEAFNHTKCA